MTAMVDWALVSRVVDAIYDASIEDRGWPEALHGCLELIGGSFAALHSTDVRDGLPRTQCSAGSDARRCALYLADWLQLQPLIGEAPEGVVMSVSAAQLEPLRDSVGGDLLFTVLERHEGQRVSFLVHPHVQQRHGPMHASAREAMALLVPHLRRALRIGRLLETAEHSSGLSQRVHSAARYFRFTPAESRVVQALVSGATLGAIARRLGVSEATVKTHLQHVFDKTGARRQVELITRLAEPGPERASLRRLPATAPPGR
jgi:DNA-binding CsgD family transcriptional regulator